MPKLTSRADQYLLHIILGLLLLSMGCVSARTQADAATAERASKTAPELVALHKEYSAHLTSGSQEGFRSTNPLVQLVDGRVIIEAVASGESRFLQADLAALGMQKSVSFGRLVSGQLPIVAIPELAKLPSLNFARAASAITHKDQPAVSPR